MLKALKKQGRRDGGGSVVYSFEASCTDTRARKHEDPTRTRMSELANCNRGGRRKLPSMETGRNCPGGSKRSRKACCASCTTWQELGTPKLIRKSLQKAVANRLKEKKTNKQISKTAGKSIPQTAEAQGPAHRRPPMLFRSHHQGIPLHRSLWSHES